MKRTFAALIALVVLAGCSPGYDPLSAEQQLASRRLQLGALTYQAVDSMVDQIPDVKANNGLVVVGSVEDIHDVNSSTPFGNIVSEMVRTRLVQRGVNVQELRVRSSVLLERQSGEMLLSRDTKSLRAAPAASEFVTGTYAVGNGSVFVSLKIIDAGSGRIVAASDFVATRSGDVDRLLGGGVYSSVR
jgi:TolB-like protein